MGLRLTAKHQCFVMVLTIFEDVDVQLQVTCVKCGQQLLGQEGLYGVSSTQRVCIGATVCCMQTLESWCLYRSMEWKDSSSSHLLMFI